MILMRNINLSNTEDRIMNVERKKKKNHFMIRKFDIHYSYFCIKYSDWVIFKRLLWY